MDLLLRKWMSEERILEGNHVVWACPKVLILFPGNCYT